MAVLSFVGVLALIYLGIKLSLPPVKQGQAIVTVRDVSGEPGEAFKEVMARYKNGGVMTLEEQRVVEEKQIRTLEQFDPKAAAYAREMLEQGYLGEDEYEYLSQKRKEFSQWVTDEMRRYYERRNPDSNVEWPAPE